MAVDVIDKPPRSLSPSVELASFYLREEIVIKGPIRCQGISFTVAPTPGVWLFRVSGAKARVFCAIKGPAQPRIFDRINRIFQD